MDVLLGNVLVDQSVSSFLTISDKINLANAVSTAVLGLATLWIAYLVYHREEPQLKVQLTMSEIIKPENIFYGGKQDIIHISIINSGRRTVVINQIGGHMTWITFRRLLSKVKLHKRFTHYVLKFNPYIHPVLNPDGQMRVLAEEEVINILLPLPEQRTLGQDLCKWGRFYIIDSASREYSLKGSSLKRFKKEFNAWEREHPVRSVEPNNG